MRRLLARPRRLLVAAAVVIVVAALAPQALAWYHFRAGRAALAAYHTAEARRHLDACLKTWPNSPSAHLLAARAARRAGDYAAARDHLDACRDPGGKKSDDVAFEWALLQATEGDLLEVGDYLRTKAQKDPAAAPLVWEALAEGNTRMYRALTAAAVLDHWLEAEPDNPRAHFLRGQLYRIVATRKAVPEYRRAVELDPDDDAARWWLAVTLQEVGVFDEALPQLEYLRDRGWPDPDLRPRIARSLDRTGRTDEARALVERALADEPDNVLALRTRGQIETSAGDLPAAEKWLRAALRAAPSDYATSYALARCLREQHKDDEAKKQEAAAEALKDRTERFNEVRTRLMPTRPHDPALHCEMGVLLEALGHDDLAEKWLSSALHEDPDYRPAHAALANFYESRKPDPEKAAYHRERAKGEKAPDPDARPKDH